MHYFCRQQGTLAPATGYLMDLSVMSDNFSHSSYNDYRSKISHSSFSLLYMVRHENMLGCLHVYCYIRGYGLWNPNVYSFPTNRINWAYPCWNRIYLDVCVSSALSQQFTPWRCDSYSNRICLRFLTVRSNKIGTLLLMLLPPITLNLLGYRIP